MIVQLWIKVEVKVYLNHARVHATMPLSLPRDELKHHKTIEYDVHFLKIFWRREILFLQRLQVVTLPNNIWRYRNTHPEYAHWVTNETHLVQYFPEINVDPSIWEILRSSTKHQSSDRPKTGMTWTWYSSVNPSTGWLFHEKPFDKMTTNSTYTEFEIWIRIVWEYARRLRFVN